MKNIILGPMNLLYKINPKVELQLMYCLKYRYRLNLSNPITYNEKLNWMKLYYRNELMPICSDKYTVREYIVSKGYGQWLPQLLWEGKDAKQIPFEILPAQFVIKVTHGSGDNIICKDKTKLNKKDAIKKLNKWIRQKYLPCYGEWFYGLIEPRIIIEEFLSEDGTTLPKDYKLYCFNNIEGKHGVGITAVHKGRDGGNPTKTVYNSKWELKSSVAFGYSPDIENIVAKPSKYEKMVECAVTLSKPFPHARVDFYVIKDRIYIGEITFMTGSGYNKITPRSFDEKMGDWIKLP